MRICMVFCSLTVALLSGATASLAQVHPNPHAPKGGDEMSLQGQPAADAESAMANWQWVGLRKRGTSSCPKVQGWEVHDWLSQALFAPRSTSDEDVYDRFARPPSPPDLQRVAEDYKVLRSLELDRLCVYRATSKAKDLDFGGHLPAGLESAKRDRMALSPTADLATVGAAGQITWKTLASQLLIQTGKISETGTDLFNLDRQSGDGAQDDGPGVRLVFLDTEPDHEGVPAGPAGSNHGYTLTNLAEHLVCYEAGDPQHAQHCAATIATRLALPYADFKSNEPPKVSLAQSTGGDLGLLNELAQTIVREVWDWRQSRSQQHLILNLSLGWDGELFGDLKARRASQLDPVVRAVYDALRFARSQGVLVIAAAGNYRGGETKSRYPLLPAAWELRRPSWFPFVFGAKRVYAVGGVDSLGLPLPNSRDGGRPRRSAYGDHAVVASRALATEEPTPTAIYTGTSVSAAVTSSIAAVVWHLRPELSPGEVIALINRAGDRLDSPADYYAWKHLWPLSSLISAPPMTRLSLCGAVRAACGPDGKACHLAPSTLTCKWPAKAPDLSALVSGDNLPIENLSQELSAQDGPAAQWPDMPSRRWLEPTPEDNPCPGCSIVPPSRSRVTAGVSPEDYVLVMELNPVWKDDVVELTSAVLKILPYSGSKPQLTMTYTITPAQLKQLTTDQVFTFVIPIEAGTDPLAKSTATVDFQVTRNHRSYLYQSPVVVDPKPAH